nr:hypothetical protein [Pseudomonas sp. BIGb0427]
MSFLDYLTVFECCSLMARCTMFCASILFSSLQDAFVEVVHPAVVITVNLAVLVTQLAAVAVVDAKVADAVADVDGGIEGIAHQDVGLDQVRADRACGPAALGDGLEDGLLHLLVAVVVADHKLLLRGQYRL